MNAAPSRCLNASSSAARLAPYHSIARSPSRLVLLRSPLHSDSKWRIRDRAQCEAGLPASSSPCELLAGGFVASATDVYFLFYRCQAERRTQPPLPPCWSPTLPLSFPLLCPFRSLSALPPSLTDSPPPFPPPSTPSAAPRRRQRRRPRRRRQQRRPRRRRRRPRATAIGAEAAEGGPQRSTRGVIIQLSSFVRSTEVCPGPRARLSCVPRACGGAAQR